MSQQKSFHDFYHFQIQFCDVKSSLFKKMRGERAILLDVFFCPNKEWLFVWLLHALIYDIMRSSHDVIHQTCLVAIKHCFTWFFLSSFHVPWSHGVTFLGTVRRLWWSWLWCFSSKFSSLSTSPSFVHPGKSLWDEDNFDEQLRDFVLQKRKETPETEGGI